LSAKTVKHSSFNSLRWSTLGMILPKIVNPLVSLLLVNIISADDYGIFAIISFIISFINLVQGFGFIEFLIKEKEPSESLLCTIFWTNLLASIGVYLALVFSSKYISHIYKIADLVYLIPISGLIVLINPIQIINSSILQKNLEYKKIFFLQFSPTIILFLITLPLALLKFGVWSLIASQVLSSFLGAILYFKFSSWRPKFIFSKEWLTKIIKFGKWVTLEKVIEYLYSNFDLILVGYLCDISQFGIYSIARSLSTVLFTTVNGPLGVILLPILSKLVSSRENIREYFLSISKRIYAINLSIIIFVLIFSYDCLPYVFINKYELIWLIPIMVCGEGISRLIWIQRDMFKILNLPKIYPLSIIPNIAITLVVYLCVKTTNVYYFAIIKVSNDILYFIIQNLLVKYNFKISLVYVFKYSKALIFSGGLSAVFFNVLIYLINKFVGLNFIELIFVAVLTLVYYIFVFSKLDKVLFSFLLNDLLDFTGKKIR
jgi:O-antigen/teichoic acid export membrane protein